MNTLYICLVDQTHTGVEAPQPWILNIMYYCNEYSSLSVHFIIHGAIPEWFKMLVYKRVYTEGTVFITSAVIKYFAALLAPITTDLI